jgi:ABC-type lipoprotein release transport system permease subunit
MLPKLAWRNLWRNPRRTMITVLALALGVMAIVSLHSFREVSNQEMIRGVTRGLVGHIQIHGRGYQEAPDMTTVVAHAAAVESKVMRVLPEARTEKRVLGAGLAGSGDLSSPAMILGIEVTNPATRGLLTLQQGRMLGGGSHEAVIGSGLASELHQAPGGELVLVGQAADGSLANDRFTVVGTADAGSSEANATAVFLPLAEAQSFFALGESVHQIVVRLPQEAQDLTPTVARLRATLDPAELELLSWNEMLPELVGVIEAKRRNSHLVDLVVLLIVALGVLNTMTMSTFERTREFGVLASLGTRPGRILGMVVLEGLLEGLIGLGLGVSLAWALLHGIGTADFSGLGGGVDVLGARLPEAVRLTVYPPAALTAFLVTLLTMLVGGLIPAIRASRLKPTEATRYV